MAKAVLICGKLCCGKSTYAKCLREGRRAVVLSVDEIMLAVFGLYAGENHDGYAARVRGYLFEKSLEFLRADVDVILDWGFWTKDGRDEAKRFYRSRNIECETHYIELNEETWRARVDQRNRQVLAGETTAYPVDENLAAKFATLFEAPGREEIDVWVSEQTPEGEQPARKTSSEGRFSDTSCSFERPESKKIGRQKNN